MRRICIRVVLMVKKNDHTLFLKRKTKKREKKEKESLFKAVGELVMQGFLKKNTTRKGGDFFIKNPKGLTFRY